MGIGCCREDSTRQTKQQRQKYQAPPPRQGQGQAPKVTTQRGQPPRLAAVPYSSSLPLRQDSDTIWSPYQAQAVIVSADNGCRTAPPPDEHTTGHVTGHHCHHDHGGGTWSHTTHDHGVSTTHDHGGGGGWSSHDHGGGGFDSGGGGGGGFDSGGGGGGGFDSGGGGGGFDSGGGGGGGWD